MTSALWDDLSALWDDPAKAWDAKPLTAGMMSVGGIEFDGGKGTPLPAPTPGQRAAFGTNAVLYGMRRAQYPREQGKTQVFKRTTQSAGDQLLAAARGLIGSDVMVTWGHGSIGPCRVSDAVGRWNPGRHSRGGTGVMEILFTFAAPDGSGIKDRAARVQVSSNLSTWVDQPWVCDAAADGLGTTPGESQASVDGVPDRSQLGKYVRLVKVDDSAVIYWHGIIVAVSVAKPRGKVAPIQSIYRFAQIGAALDAVYLTKWTENNGDDFQGPAIGGDADIGRVLTINDQPGGDTLLNGGQVFSARGAPDGNLCTAHQLVVRILAHYADQNPSAPALSIDGAAAALLTYSAPWRLHGKSIFGMLAEIINPDHGRSFRVVVSGSALVLKVYDIRAAGTAYDLTTTDAGDWTLDVDAGGVVDRLYVEGPRPIWLGTLALKATGDNTTDLVKGWTSADETEWDNANDLKKASQKLNHVWRRFYLRRDWNLVGLNDSNLTTAYKGARVVDGTGQETGDLESAGSVRPNARVAVEIERALPFSGGRDIKAGSTDGKIDPRETWEGPLMLWQRNTVWEAVTHTTSLHCGPLGEILVGNDVADARKMKTEMSNATTSFNVTVAYRHPLPWRVSSLRTPEPRTMPRMGWYQVSGDYFQKIETQSANSCIIGQEDNSGSGLVYARSGRIDAVGNSLIIRRDAIKEYWHNPDVTAAFSFARVDTTTGEPGTCVASFRVVTNPATPTPPTAVLPVGAAITHRRWSFLLDKPLMTFTCGQMRPNFKDPKVVTPNILGNLRRDAPYKKDTERRE